MIYSNLLLPGCPDPDKVFAECFRLLRNPGLLIFSTLGPDTFKELRRAWSRVDQHTHVQAQADMHNVGDALVKAGAGDRPMRVVSGLDFGVRAINDAITQVTSN